MARPNTSKAAENPRKACAQSRLFAQRAHALSASASALIPAPNSRAGAALCARGVLSAGAFIAAGAFAASALLIASPSSAQVVLDPSFSPDTVTAGEYAPGQTTDYLIRESYGQRAGDNLFHRFSRFDIPAGESATFIEDATGSGIRRVISHIGGSSASRIEGVLRSTIPNADVYLLNPRGVLFGAGAALDITGSFYTSTADNLLFSDGVRFGEIASGAPVTLSAANPTAWGFMNEAPAEIAIEGARLAVPQDQALSLVGGNLRIEGPGTTASPNISTPSGALHLVAVHSSGDVDTNPTSAPDLSSFERLGEIQISDGAVLDASGIDDQTLVIAGESLLIDDGLILARHLGTADHPGIAVDLQLRGLLRFGDSAAGTTGRLFSTALRERAPGGGPGPDVGDGGRVRIAADEVLFDGAGALLVVGNDCVDTFACADSDRPGGAGGALEIEADRFAIRNGAVVVVQTTGTGDGSSAQIRAREIEIGSDPGESAQSILLSLNAGGFDLGTTPPEGQNARGGEITIEAEESLILENGGRIRSTTLNNGQGGDLTIRAGDFQMVKSDPAALVTRSGVTAETEGPVIVNGIVVSGPTAGLGNAGDVTIVSNGDLRIENGFVRSSAVSRAAGGTGEINLSALDGTVELGRNALVTNQVSDGVGGTTTIRAKRLVVRDGGNLSSTIQNEGVAGDVRVFANDILVSGTDGGARRSLIGSRPFSAGSIGGGSSGSIQIEGRRLRVEDGAAISVSTIQFGEVGNILIGREAPLESVILDNAALEAEASRGLDILGEIEINADRVLLDRGARISTSNFGDGNAGTIRINGRSLNVRNGSLIETRAGSAGTGGNIRIETGREALISESAIRTDTRGATPNTQGGNIDIDSEVVILASSTLGATAPIGSGGQIVISGGRFLATPESTLDASGGIAALDGVVRILSAETNALNAVPRPSTVIQDPTRRLASGCDARTEALGSLFVAPPSVQGPPGEDLHAVDEAELWTGKPNSRGASQTARVDLTPQDIQEALANRCGRSQ